MTDTDVLVEAATNALIYLAKKEGMGSEQASDFARTLEYPDGTPRFVFGTTEALRKALKRFQP